MTAARRRRVIRREIPIAWRFGSLSAAMAAGYGVLFTVVADYRDAYGISERSIGVLIGIGFIAGFASQALVAPIGDRGHAQTLITVGVLLNVVGLLALGFGTSLPVLVAGRIVSGLGIGAASPAVRRVVILSDPDHVGSNLGFLLSADVFGFAFGPAVSAVLVGPVGLEAPFVVVAAATVILLVWSRRVEVIETVDETGRHFAFDLLRSRVVAGAVLLGAAVFVMIGAFDALWDVVHDDLDSPTWLANLGITLFAVPLVLLGPFSGRLAERVGPFRTGGLGLLAGSLFIFAYGQLPTGGWIFTVAMAHALTDGLTISASGVAIAMAVPEERQSGAQGLIGAAQALAGGITAVVIGAVYDASGRAAAYSVGAVAMFAVGLAGMILAAPFWIAGRHRGTVVPSADAGSSSDAGPPPELRSR